MAAVLLGLRHRFWTDDVFGQPENFHGANHTPRHVIFPPVVPVRGGAWFGVMVVVPTFTVTKERDQPIVATLISCFVIAIAEHVGNRIDGPGAVQNKNGSDGDAPDVIAGSVLQGSGASVDEVPDQGSDKRHQYRVGDKDEEPAALSLQSQVKRITEQVTHVALVVDGAVEVAVSDHDPTHVPPQEIDQRGVWIGLFVAVLMMHPMDRDPSCRRILQIAHPEDRQSMLQPSRAGKAPVSQQAVVADGDAHHAEHKVTGDCDDQTGPGEQPRDEREQCDQMDEGQDGHVFPEDSCRNRFLGWRQPLRIHPSHAVVDVRLHGADFIGLADVGFGDVRFGFHRRVGGGHGLGRSSKAFGRRLVTRLGGATKYIPTDRVIDGIDQTAMLLNGDTHGRRDHVHIYAGHTLAATVKGRYKRHWITNDPGAATGISAAFYDLYQDPQEKSPHLVPLIHTQGQFHRMRARHELMKKKYPDKPNAKGIPLTGLSNARPETKGIGEMVKRNLRNMPFDVEQYLELEIPGSKVDGDFGK